MNTKFLKKLGVFTVSIAAAFQFSASAETATNALPKFDEVYKLLKQNIVGLTGEELDQAAVRGLLRELSSQVQLGGASSTNIFDTNLVSKASIFDKAYAYVRIGFIRDGLAEKVAQEYQQVVSTNKIKGMILDLRFSSGTNYAAAAKVADLFFNSEQPLIDWGAGSASSTSKSSPITVPVAVLVNRETRAAAEALAATLHETKVGLLLGSATAGEASIFKEFPVENEQHLRIAVSPIKVSKGRTVPAEGLKPDIEVNVPLQDERSYLEDPYKTATKPIASVKMSLDTNTVAAAETNAPRSRLNEAELVRRHREGLSIDEEFVDKNRTPGEELKLVNDPVLGRALDVLKGLAVLGQTRPL